MNELLKTILEQVLKINEIEGYKASYRYIYGELAVDILRKDENIYHLVTTSVSDCEVISADLKNLIHTGSLVTVKYEIRYDGSYFNISEICKNKKDAEYQKNFLDDRFDIQCTIKALKC
jgi:hypothetical protein